MQEQARYAVGIDVGTTQIRCVVGHIDPATGTPTIVGVGHAPNSGMRKGTVVNLAGPAHAIDQALGEAERMSGYEVNHATLSVNGAHIISTKADGMIAVGMGDQEISNVEVDRLEEVATVGKIPPNRRVLDVVPFSYTLDGQGGIKNPVGMTGNRLEVNANIISAMGQHLAALEQASESATVVPNATVAAPVASAKAVLTEQQMENGVAVIDLGGATTGVAVFEEGDLQYVGVIPVGGVNITNDLAIGLKTDPEIAEKVKLQHAAIGHKRDVTEVTIKHDKESLTFAVEDIDEIVEARLEEIFELINKELKKAGCAGRLPNGVVLVGGSANLKGIVEFTKDKLAVAARLGKAAGFGGVADNIDKPEYAAAVGLMLKDAEGVTMPQDTHKGGGASAVHLKNAGGLLKGLLARIKS